MNELENARKIINEVDREMAKLFEKRMLAVKNIASYKKAHALPILDSARENEIMASNLASFTDEELREYYDRFLKETIAISRSYQAKLNEQ